VQSPKENIGEIRMKELLKISGSELALLCYIKEVAREREQNIDLRPHVVVEVINELLEAYTED